jgi:hypothetical protein
VNSIREMYRRWLGIDSHSRKLSEEIGFFRKLRNAMRSKFFAVLNHVASIEDTRRVFSRMLSMNNITIQDSAFRGLRQFDFPYANLGGLEKPKKTRLRSDIIFITGRFRSGSTVLWNLFRNMSSVTAFYEPFNERRWFDEEARGSVVDSSHLNVSEYWSEYKNLGVLAEYYNEDWTRRQLYMGPNSWNPDMQRYIEIIAEKTKNRPVLQFNRIDFRLPWIRDRFPRAKIIHIFRHPRDQWCSALRDMMCFPTNGKLGCFEKHDRFYLLTWGKDLKHNFPFLNMHEESHPYELFYQIWKLSYLFGKSYADLSISLEKMLDSPSQTIKNLLVTLGLNEIEIGKLAGLVEPVSTGKWIKYASNEWFSAIEAKADFAMEDFLCRSVT